MCFRLLLLLLLLLLPPPPSAFRSLLSASSAISLRLREPERWGRGAGDERGEGGKEREGLSRPGGRRGATGQGGREG